MRFDDEEYMNEVKATLIGSVIMVIIMVALIGGVLLICGK